MTDNEFKQIVREIQGKYFKQQHDYNLKILRNVKKVFKFHGEEYQPNAFVVAYDYIIANNHAWGHKCNTWRFNCIKDFYSVFGTRIQPSEYKLKLKIIENKEDYDKQRSYKFKIDGSWGC